MKLALFASHSRKSRKNRKKGQIGYAFDHFIFFRFFRLYSSRFFRSHADSDNGLPATDNRLDSICLSDGLTRSVAMD